MIESARSARKSTHFIDKIQFEINNCIAESILSYSKDSTTLLSHFSDKYDRFQVLRVEKNQ